MTVDIVIIGIDPGEVTGIAKIRLRSNVTTPGRTVLSGQFAQVTSGLVMPILHGMLMNIEQHARIVVATERFVVSSRAGRSANSTAGVVARDVITLAGAWARKLGATVVERSAADVKPWATDERLDRAGLLDKAQKMRHARDAGRHALYEAVKNQGVADPLSARAGAR